MNKLMTSHDLFNKHSWGKPNYTNVYIEVRKCSCGKYHIQELAYHMDKQWSALAHARYHKAIPKYTPNKNIIVVSSKDRVIALGKPKYVGKLKERVDIPVIPIDDIKYIS